MFVCCAALLVIVSVVSGAPECTRTAVIHDPTTQHNGLLSDLARMYGTDKVTHGYTSQYERLFDGIKSRVRKIAEVGVFFGASIKMWHDYFTHARIIGIDAFNGELGNGHNFARPRSFLDEQNERPLDRVELVIGSQNVRRDLVLFAEKHLAGSFDIIIDDGSHAMKEQQETFATLFHLVRPGGYFVIEDVHTSWEHGQRDLLADGSNSLLLMGETFVRRGRIESQYLSLVERQFLEREIDSLQIIYTNRNESCLMVFRRAFPMGLRSDAPTRRVVNHSQRRSFDAQRDTYVAASFSNHVRFDTCARKSLDWTKSWGAQDSIVYSSADFNCEFIERAAGILRFPFGGGYYVWKPLVVQNTLRSTNADFVVYHDACSRIEQDMSSLLQNIPKSVFLVVFQLEDFHLEHIWTKSDLLDALGCTAPYCADSPQICATASVWRAHDPRSIAFTELWLETGIALVVCVVSDR